ncbi:eukaryotic translation initiation factor 4 gamma 3 [Caerostris extrusa]|uniref:Eukaryotic translation initiation factor 4 gamma 3 n=1 Tax=Caerostris extrusa TaxID=172846 RepID=A0AAV4VVD9_CAEEX|nr:eukaryotic translation initiation factor 4 gamma 3 [Caerostris extrusa]
MSAAHARSLLLVRLARGLFILFARKVIPSSFVGSKFVNPDWAKGAVLLHSASLAAMMAAASERSRDDMPGCKNPSNSDRWNRGKKNKTKKKKDYNKRVESKEGGEMDAFLDTKEAGTVSSVHPSPAPVVPAATPSVPTPENLFAPVTITDAEFLKNIPLPGEILEDVQNDVSPSEPSSDASSVSPNTDNEDNKENTEAQNKITLKYTYKEDQWSPLNPEGKKQYDRDFLLQLQSQPMSLCKPNNLPNLDVIKDKAQIQRLTEMNRMPPPMITPIRAYNDPFVPQYARANTGPSNSSCSSEGPADAPTEQVELDKLKRNIQGVLNKLTPQKFETLVGQVKNLNIDNEEKLSLVIDLVFEKAVDEPNFSVPYANLCKHLALIKVPVAGSSSHVNFRKLLLTKCQKEFEVDRTDTDPWVKVEIDEEEEKKIRYRQLGNIRFIGELFKLSMLIEPIMHECIKKLLIQGDDESLECLCKLLKTIGKELDDGKSGKSREESKMDNNWIPRRDENNPKTIDQIHKEAEREAREQQQVFQNINNYTKRMPDERDRRKNTSRMGQSEDGWTSSSKSNKGSYSMVDPSKLKLTKPDEVESIRLGPGGRGLQSWGRGSSGGTKTSVDSDVKTTLTNRFNALAETNIASNYEGRRGSQRSAASSRESSRGRNNQLPPAIRKTPSTSKERENLLETVKGLTRAAEVKVPENKKTDSHLNGKITESEDLSLKGPEYNEDDMDKKTKPLIDEFLHNNDF